MLCQTAATVGPATALPLQAFEPVARLGSSPPTRAMAAFLASTLVGGFVVYRYGGRVDDAVEASTANPLVSAVYGVMAYGLVAFFGAYAFSQLSRVGVGATAVATVSGLALIGILLSLGGVGYAVLGTWLADAAGFRDPFLGVAAAGLVGAVAVLALPTLPGTVAWFVVAAVGLGGPAKRWVHEDNAKRQAREG